MAQDITLSWGALQFAGPTEPDTAYRVDAMADGTNFDNPEPLLEVVKSLLTDGSLAVLQGWDNREVAIRLRLSAADGQIAGPALAAAEAALMGEVLADAKSPLVYVPPADDAATCVFDVVAARLDRDTSDGWDFDEVKRGDRFYLLTLTCLPFARPELPVEVAALAPAPATETHFTVDSGTSTTGWTVTSAGVGTATRRNLVANPSFESSINHWTGTNVSTFNRAWDDGYFAYFKPPGGASAANIYSTTAATSEGIAHTASAYLAASGSGVTDIKVGVQFLSSTGVLLSQSHSPNLAPSTTWTQAGVTATSPAGTAKVRVIVSGTFAVSSTDTAWVNDVLLEASGSLGSYFDGSTPTSGSTQHTWAGSANASTSVAYTVPTASVSSGAVVASGNVHSEDAALTLTRTGAVSMTSTPYLRVSTNWYGAGASAGAATFRIDGDRKSPLAAMMGSVAGYVDYYFASGDFTTFSVEVAAGTATAVTMGVAHIERTNKIAGSSSTTREQTRSAEVVGSAPTQAAINLYDATPAALGADVLVYTTRNTARSPALRALMTSSATVTVDAAMVSGSRNTFASAMVFRLPAAALTEGTYALMGRLNVTVAGTLTWQARMVSSTGATTVGSTRITTGSTALAVTSGYQVLTLGSVALPVVAVEDDQMVELTLTGTANMTVDEAWLFGLDDGALTWIKDTDSLTWIEIRSPELGAARPSVYGGTGVLGDNSVCIDWKCESFGAHRFDPGMMQVFTVTTTSLVSQSTLEFYPRYHSHVEDDSA